MEKTVLFDVFIAQILIKKLASRLSSPAVILDVGCGDGHVMSMVKNAFWDPKCYATDINTELIAQNRDDNEGIIFNSTLPTHIPYANEAFDILYMVNVLHHLKATEQNLLLQDLKRILKKGGVFIIIETNPYSLQSLFSKKECLFLKISDLKKIDYDFYKKSDISYAYECTLSFSSQLSFIVDKLPFGICWVAYYKNSNF